MREKVSVAMASFNGEKYISTQIKTILENLTENDELVISDDGSTDGTRRIIEGFNDSRIRLLEGPKQGVKKNFENAIRNCSGKYIFLSDQDDVWMCGKRASATCATASGCIPESVPPASTGSTAAVTACTSGMTKAILFSAT